MNIFIKITYNLFIAITFFSIFWGDLKAQDRWYDNLKIDYRMELGATASIITGMDANWLPNPSARIGISADLKLKETPFYISSGLFITQKGVKLKFADDSKITANPSYIQVPFDLGYRIDFKEDSNIAFFFGPYVAYGVVGKYKTEGKAIGNSSNNIFSKEIKKVNRFDTGLGASFIYQKETFTIRMGFEYGFMKSINLDKQDVYWRIKDSLFANNNFQAYISLGYRFYY